jgi:tetratricopeptide (TPR) repeat protein
LEAALGFAQQATEAFWATGDLHRWGFAAYQMALALSYQGGLLQALAHCQRLVRLGQEGAYHRVQCWGLLGQGFVLQRFGQLDEALAVLKEGLQLAEAIPDQAFCISASADLGRCYLRRGDLEQALAALDTSLAFYAPYLGGDSYASLRNGLAEAYLFAAEQRGQTEEADWLKKAKHACKDARKQGKAFRPGLPEAMRLQGTYEWLRGKPSAAQRWWQRSLALAEEMGQRYDKGMTYLEVGRRLGERAHLERAKAILADIGAMGDPASVREALRTQDHAAAESAQKR